YSQIPTPRAPLNHPEGRSGGSGPNLRDHGREDRAHRVNFSLRVFPAQRQADERCRDRLWDPHRHQDVRGLERSRGAGRPAGGADTMQVERGKERDAVRSSRGEGKGIGQTRRASSMQADAVDLAEGPGESIAQRPETTRIEHGRADKTGHGLSQPKDRRQILGASAAFVFMTAAKENRVRLKGGSDVEQGGAFWSVKLVGTKRNEVRVEL